MIITDQHTIDHLMTLFNLVSAETEKETYSGSVANKPEPIEDLYDPFDPYQQRLYEGEIEVEPSHDEDANIDEEGNMKSNHPDYNYNKHIIELINQITVKTLTQEGKLADSSIRNLSILHNIKLDLTTLTRTQNAE